MEIWNYIGLFCCGFITGFVMCCILFIARDRL